MAERCHWVRSDQGETIMIPGCWDRVHNPDAPCTCGEWSEEEARRLIKGLRQNLYRERHESQRLRAKMREAGIADEAAPYDFKAATARQRRRAMHMMISAAGHGEQEAADG